MDTNDPHYPIPVLKLSSAGYPGKTCWHYREIKAGRLVATKVGHLTFILKGDADAWLMALPKMKAAASPEIASAVEIIRRLAAAVDSGKLDRKSVLERLTEAARPLVEMRAA